ncbi:hypothetical protein B0A48_13133 [Cryoendolithus antarcticus]|uniref:Heterokaryon incompatibility domain-containing protein n=1 Tax=Cryoendolithus antarcticus TaxID=1507870 RepID=A0A1V8SND0_9PEZI|nr:hypothetical protein B0A48_13133 [Cryoendolithus antarcticus]
MADGDDDFEIDIYGDDDEQQIDSKLDEPGPAAEENKDEDSKTEAEATATTEALPTNPPSEQATAPASAPTGLSLKRKVSDAAEIPTSAELPSDPNATPALRLSELHWWTTEEDLRGFCAAASAESHMTDISFGEHRQNGKSRGEAYLEFSTPSASAATKREIEHAVEVGSDSIARGKTRVVYCSVGNPFKGKDAGAGEGRKFGGQAGRFDNAGGAYNNSYASRGRGGGPRGGGGYNRGGQQQANTNAYAQNGARNQQGQWGNGGFANPMMNGFNPMAFNPMAAMGGAGGFNPMMNARGGGMMGMGMNMMAGQGGYGMGMNGMNGMNGGWEEGEDGMTQVIRTPSVFSDEPATYESLYLGPPLEWNVHCPLCRLFANAAKVELNDMTPSHVIGLEHWLIPIDVWLNARDWDTYGVQRLRPSKSMIVATSDDLFSLDMMESTPYLALSYVWSEVDNDVQDPSGDLQIVTWSPLIEDAMSTTLKLGYQFLWIDRYCIDEEHRTQQIRCMNDIYAGADATIVAADHVRGHRRGLCGIQPRAPLSAEVIDGREYCVMPTFPQSSLSMSTWYRRAWTYQEWILSRRRLVFLHDQVYFECLEGRDFEALEDNVPTVEDADGHDLAYGPSHAFGNIIACDDPLFEIYRHLRDYTSRDIGFATDALNAIEGVLDRWQRLNPDLRYLTGLPIDLRCPFPGAALELVLLYALSWEHNVGEFCNRRGEFCNRRREFPSWTWAGWEKPHPNLYHQDQAYRVNTYRVSIQVQDDTSAFQSLSSLLIRDFTSQRNKHIYGIKLRIDCPVVTVVPVEKLQHGSWTLDLVIEKACDTQRVRAEEVYYSSIGDCHRLHPGTLVFLALGRMRQIERPLAGLLVIEKSPGWFERLDFLRLKTPHIESLDEDLLQCKRTIILA